MVMVLAMVSTRLPRQNGHVVGRVTASPNRDSNVIAVFLRVHARHIDDVVALLKQNDHQRQCSAGCDSSGKRDGALLDVSVMFNTSRHPCGPASIRGARHQGRFDEIGSHGLSVPTCVGNRCSRLHIIQRELVLRRAARVTPCRVGRASQGFDRCSLSRGRRSYLRRRNTG